MKLEMLNGTLSISELQELREENYLAFRAQVDLALPESVTAIEVDLSQTTYLDRCGIGALISLRKLANDHNGTVRLINPPPRVEMLLESMHMQNLFEFVRKGTDLMPPPRSSHTALTA